MEAQHGPHLTFVAEASTSLEDTGIVSYAIRNHELLALAASYWTDSLAKEHAPPWSKESEYSTIVTSALDIESNFHVSHRFVSAKFAERPLNELEGSRHYWSPWLVTQLTFHTAYCLLNHPILLSTHLKSFRGIIPQSFIETSLDQARVHVDWIVYFLEMLEKKQFRVSDPLLGYCALMAATISLHFRRARLSEVRDHADRGYSICLRWLENVSPAWQNISVMARLPRGTCELIGD